MLEYEAAVGVHAVRDVWGRSGEAAGTWGQLISRYKIEDLVQWQRLLTSRYKTQSVSLEDWTLSCFTLPCTVCQKCRVIPREPARGPAVLPPHLWSRSTAWTPRPRPTVSTGPSAGLWARPHGSFGVQPKFTNVDIRLTLGVTFGAVDLYVSTSYDTFVVRVAPDTGVHTVHIQPPPRLPTPHPC